MKIKINRNDHDYFARYQMPSLEVSYEGKATNTKTILKNISCICKSLNRDLSIIPKFIEIEKGFKIETKNDKFSIKGMHRPEDLQNAIYDFIDMFVLCGVCNNPETLYKLNCENVFMECLACGEKTCLEEHKILKSIVNEIKKTGENIDKKYGNNNYDNEVNIFLDKFDGKNSEEISFEILSEIDKMNLNNENAINAIFEYTKANFDILNVLKFFNKKEEILNNFEKFFIKEKLDDKIEKYLKFFNTNEIISKDECIEYFQNKSKVLKRDESNLIRKKVNKYYQ
ncbi:Eukaryotic translation initiation factor 5A-1 [Gurleya vavrai]